MNTQSRQAEYFADASGPRAKVSAIGITESMTDRKVSLAGGMEMIRG